MPKKYNKKYSKKRYSKKKYSVSTARLKTAKIDSLVESRMLAIAKKEDRKNNPSLCLRRYCWVDYDPFTNEFANLGTAPSNTFDWEGQAICLTRFIVKQDTATVTNIGVLDNPLTQLREDVDRANDGANILTTVKHDHGRRTGEEIFIRGWSLDCRIICNFSHDPGVPEPNLYDKIDIHIALIKIRRELGIVFAPKQLMRINPWGYHSALDSQIEQENYLYNPVTLFRTKVTVTNGTEMHPNIIFRKFKGYFKNPVKISYAENDINARTPNYDVYLVCRSTVASTGDAEDDWPQPYVQTCAKLYYTNNK